MIYVKIVLQYVPKKKQKEFIKYFNKAYKVTESIINEAKEITTTVDEFFKWYSGGDGSNWEKDDEYLNSTTIDNDHAQDNFKESDKWFKSHKKTKIKIKSKPFQGNYELEFKLDGKLVSIDSTNVAMAASYND